MWIAAPLTGLLVQPVIGYLSDRTWTRLGRAHLAPKQRPLGYAMQSFFIGLGAIVASALPWILAHLGFSNIAVSSQGDAKIPDTVRYAFDAGAAVLMLAILW